MRKKWMFPILLLCFLVSGTVHAGTHTENEITETLTLTEENRYDSVYYQKPEELYPAVKNQTMRTPEISLEEYVVNALENFQTKIDVSAYKIPREEAAAKYFQILNSHPSLFYVAGSVKWSYEASTNTVTGYDVQYTDTEENVKIQKEDFEKEIRQALTWADDSMTDAEKALAVHDYLVLECEYDYDRLQNETLPDISYSAYGALVNKMAVCDGYSRAYACILEKLGISSVIVTSSSMNHAWNQVCIDESWYHVDVTWDDPVRDCIGRVNHRYFLLSDTAVSDSTHNHAGWSGGYEADSTSYDEKFWSGITTAFCYQNGTWYYGDYFSENQETAVLKREGHLLTAAESIVCSEHETWNNYIGCFMYLDLEPVEKEIYFNTRTKIYKIKEDGTIETDEEGYVPVYQPECQNGRLIFGFTVRGAKLCYALQEAPNLDHAQAVVFYTVEELQKPQITGITAKDLETVYDETAKQIEVKGTLEGDRITYKHEDDVYRLNQPEMKNTGTYQVLYKVEREGCEPYTGEAGVLILKAEPEYVIPDGLQGTIGSLLGQVILPEGFVWEEESAAVELREAGEVTGYVSYVPSDTQNYESVFHIPVQIAVSCSGHVYIEEVTVEATATQEGLMTCTCRICGDTYTRVIPMQKPDDTETPGQKPDDTEIPGQKPDDTGGETITDSSPGKAKLSSVKKKGNSKAKITWKKVTDADGYEIFMRTGKGGYKKIKTIAKGKKTAFTKSGLKKGKVYRFRIRAYKKAGNSKLYGKYSNVKTLKMK